MLVLRNEQIEALREAMADAFAARVAVELRRQYPEKLEETSEPRLRQLVRDSLDRAKIYGVTSESDVKRYAEYEVEFGPGFDRKRWAGAILTSNQTGTEKMDDLDAYTTFELRS